MSRLNLQNRMEGHRIEGPSNRDLEQKLTYQQLLNLNHDLSKENMQLKNIGNRLGQQLRNLHSQFDIKPRDENADLYNAIGNHPMLHQYELTLIPLLDAYEAKIQQFENGFETINEEFINLEKKYQLVASENERIRAELTDRTKELIEVYRTGSSEKLGADFSQLILQQINEKQRFLVEENARLDKQYQRFKSEADRNSRDLKESKVRENEATGRVKQLELNQKQMESEVRNLKEKLFDFQMKSNELESEKKKIEKDLQRALSQVSQLNRDKDSLNKNYDSLKQRFEREAAPQQQYSNYTNPPERTRNPLEETRQQSADDSHKKLAKIQKEFEAVVKERNKLKEQVEQNRVNLEETNDRLAQLRKKYEAIDAQKRNLEISELKNKKLLEQLAEKSRNQLEKLRKQQEEEAQKIEDEYYVKLEAKQKKINEVEEALDKLKLERDKLEQENIIHTTLTKEGKQAAKGKDSDRLVDKLKEKLAINEQLFRQQLSIVENDNVYLKREADAAKAQVKDRNEELRKLRQELEKVKRELTEIGEQKSILVEEIKRVRNEYEGNLKDKERLFDQKIRQIKLVVEESDKRRKTQREKVAEASREYKRVLQEIKNTYEERIKVLQGENSAYNSKGKKGDVY